MRRLVFIPALIFVVFCGCTKSTKIDAASYIEISDYKVITDSMMQGTSIQKFTDVLFTSATQNYGYFPIPCKIPLPLEGATYLSIRPAIQVNGVKFIRTDYPMFRGCDTTLPLLRGQNLQVTPVFKYYSSVTFPFLEDFEGATCKFSSSTVGDTITAKIDTANAAYGNQCLMLQMDATHSIVQVQSNNGYALPASGKNVYVELQYKGNFKMEVGLIGSSTPQSIFNPSQRSAGGVNPSAAWKKMYIDVTSLVRTPPYSNYWFVYLYSEKDWDPSVTPQMYVDNVKLVVQ